jgi:tripartite-type tricarboxylate transporter receptor subunit TctC
MKKIIAMLCLLPAMAFAWQPTKPIISYIGYGPGSGNELAFRGVIAEIEKTNPGINFVVQNVPGADSVISVNQSYKLPADGLTLNVTSIANFGINEVFNSEGMLWTVNDLNPVIGIASSPMAIVAKTTSSVNNVEDLIKYFKNPGKPVNVAVGSATQQILFGLIMEKISGDLKSVKTVMYKGPAQALQDVLGEPQVEFAMLPLAVTASMVNSGKIKIVGLSGNKRMPQFPNTQLVKEFIPGVVIQASWQVTLPNGAPKEVVDWYVSTFSKAIKSDNLKKYFESNYMLASESLTPELIKKEMSELRSVFIPVGRRIKAELDAGSK